MSDRGDKRPEAERRLDDRVPTQVRVRLKYPDVETFLERYATNVSRGGIFIQTQRTKPPGTLIRFEFQIQDASPVIRGEGRVSWVVPYDPAHAERAYGMGVKFTKLDGRSKSLIDRVVAHKLKRGQRDDPNAPPPPEVAELGPVRDVSTAEHAARTPPRASPVGASPVGASSETLDAQVAELLASPLSIEIRALIAKILGQASIDRETADRLLAELEASVPASRPASQPAPHPRPASVRERPASREPGVTSESSSPGWESGVPGERSSPEWEPGFPGASSVAPAPAPAAAPATAPASVPETAPEHVPVADPTVPIEAPPVMAAPEPRDPTPPPAPVVRPPRTTPWPRRPRTPMPTPAPTPRIDRLLAEAAPGAFELDLDGLAAPDEEPPATEDSGWGDTGVATEAPAAAAPVPPETISDPHAVMLPFDPVAPTVIADATDAVVAPPESRQADYPTEREMPGLGDERSAEEAAEDWEQITVIPEGTDPSVAAVPELTPPPEQLLDRTPVDPSLTPADLGVGGASPAGDSAGSPIDDPAFSMEDAPLIEEGDAGPAERTIIGGSAFGFQGSGPTSTLRVDGGPFSATAPLIAPDPGLEITATHPPVDIPATLPMPEAAEADADGALFGTDIEVEVPPDAGAQRGLPLLDEPLVDDFGLDISEGTPVEAEAPITDFPIQTAPAEEVPPEEHGVPPEDDGAGFLDMQNEPTMAQDALEDDDSDPATVEGPGLGDAFVFAQTVQAEALSPDDPFGDRTLAHEAFPDDLGPFATDAALTTAKETVAPETIESAAPMDPEQAPAADGAPPGADDGPKKGFFRKLFGNK